MITQGYPLWAVESDGTAYVVVGWDEYQYPFLLRLDAPGAALRNPLEHERYTFTTADPRRPAPAPGTPSRVYDMSPDEIAAELAGADDLRERLRRLADGMERNGHHHAASAIRQELAR